MSYRELLIGCGNRRDKVVRHGNIEQGWQNLTTLDVDPSCEPDVVHDLAVLPYPFDDNTFDEIHAYHVLEHFGAQGDYKAFFAQFTEFHRILKPGGYFIGSCPMWDQEWAWGDPGHKRIISANSLSFLSQDWYKEQVGKSAASDYRSVYKVDFEIIGLQERGPQFFFALRRK